MALCIPKKNIDEVAEIIMDSNSVSRLNKLTKLFGSKESAQEINLLFEKSLLLKNQKNAFKKFINDIDGVSIEKKKQLRENFEANRDRKNNLITDEELTSISKDIYDRKHKLDIEPETVQALARLKKEADDLKVNMKTEAQRQAYGEKVLKVRDIVSDLISPESKLGFKDTLKFSLKQRKQRIKDTKNPLLKVIQGGVEVLDVVTSPAWKPFKAAWDASYSLRQGAKGFIENPKAYIKNIKKTNHIWKNVFNDKQRNEVFRMFERDVVSDELYDEMIGSGLELLRKEEEFAAPLAEKLPTFVGKLFSGSDQSFTMFVQSQRVDLFKKFYKAETLRTGAKPTKEFTKEMSSVVNSLTGRGSFSPRFDSILTGANRALFSGRFAKAQIDTLVAPFNGVRYRNNPQAYHIMAKNTYKNVTAVAGIMATASLVTEVGWDPTASNFGKAKIPGSKNTWVDLTAGIGSYIVLATRSALAKSTSVSSGKVYDLNTGEWGSRDVLDLWKNFAFNKLAPGSRAVLEPVLKGRTFDGEKSNIKDTTTGLVVPISVEKGYELMNNETFIGAVIGELSEIGGLGVSTYK